MNHEKTFIETQFPIAKLSAESYKERKANLGQTLTGLGKWWGRKPLVLVRACILGMLMPASNDPAKDMEIFLKILTMDSDGVWGRRKASYPDRELLKRAPEYKEIWKTTPKEDREELRETIHEGLTVELQKELEELRRFEFSRDEFEALGYADRIKHCLRPENIEGPSESSWVEINAHLGTTAKSLDALIEQLGQRRFGHRPKVGDAFCGGGSIPFEAARIGCEAFASDLNPVATLLTWGSLNLLGGGLKVQEEVQNAQKAAFEAAQKQIADWGIETSEEGWQAEAYLYCVEVRPQGSLYPIPLAPSWRIGERTDVVGVLELSRDGSGVEIRIVTKPDSATHQSVGTVDDGRVIDPFDPSRSWSIEGLRGPKGLRRWDKDDLVPRADDVFQERLYCIRWRTFEGKKIYRAPSAFDLANETKALTLLGERLAAWREAGFIPSAEMPLDGDKTDEPIRTRGWTHWHHLFTPRQLLTNGLLLLEMWKRTDSPVVFLVASRVADWNSRLCAWMPHAGNEKGNQVFTNQALNTQYNYSCRPLEKLETSKITFPLAAPISTRTEVSLLDARRVDTPCDLWITDPPYADAVNYHELADFFMAWHDKRLPKAFPGWLPDGSKALAVRGAGADFKKSMVEIYKNLGRLMPDNGLQMVQFTHQDPSVWADLGMILWAAGLRVTAAWTVATETPAGGLKKGNYVQGTVLLVLRKRTDAQDAFLDELYPQVEDEVRRQIDTMHRLDDESEPNFGDTDYQLAAYAAALRVLTQFQRLDGQDVGHELFRLKTKEKSRFEQVIDRAIAIACDYMIPRGLENSWPSLTPDERFYLRALDVESRGERRQGVYTELARGFGVREFKPILADTKANNIRLKTASEFGKRDLGPVGAEGFGGTILRQLLFAVCSAVQDGNPSMGFRYLKDGLSEYWQLRSKLVDLLDWLVELTQADGMEVWRTDADAARLVAGLLRGDHA